VVRAGEARAMCGMGGDTMAPHGADWGAGAACGMATVSEVPATKER
jgi:hypothetical protein